VWLSVVWYLCFEERESETKTYIVLSACGPIMRVTAAWDEEPKLRGNLVIGGASDGFENITLFTSQGHFVPLGNW